MTETMYIGSGDVHALMSGKIRSHISPSCSVSLAELSLITMPLLVQ